MTTGAEGFTVSDFATIALSIVALVVAFIALILARRQVRLAEQQLLMAKRQEVIGLKQAEIAEKQDRLLEEQLRRRLDLRVRARGQNRHMTQDTQWGPTTLGLDVLNNGNKTAVGFYWEVFIPREMAFRVRFVSEDGELLEGRFATFSETEVYDKLTGFYQHRLFPNSETDGIIARLWVPSDGPDEFTVKWRLRTEDGLVPAIGLAEIGYRRISEGDVYSFLEVWPPAGNGNAPPAQ